MRLAPFLSYGALIWVAAIIAAPLLVTSGSAAAVLGGVLVYRAASVVCHQIPQRSFCVSAWPLAVCARCFGLYAGAAIASLAMTSTSPRRSPSTPPANSRWTKTGSSNRIASGPQSGIWMVLAVAAVPTGATWLLERTGMWAGSNVARFAAAIPLGLTAAWIVLAAIRAERADTIH